MSPGLLILTASSACCALLPGCVESAATEQAEPQPSVSAPREVPAAASLDNWPAWRGPRNTGVAPKADPPLEWSEEKNIAWKVELPGQGHATPVVWDDRIFITTAVPYGQALPPRHSDAPGAHDNAPVTHHHRFIVLAINRADGGILWQKTVHEQLPIDQGHVSASLASGSPVTDGTHIYAFFGSHGLYCLDWSGEIVWDAQLGRMFTKHGHGEGASPALHGDRIFINWDHEAESFVAAFDKRTGEELWRTERAEPTSWATPIVVEFDGNTQLIVPGTNRTRGYDVETGETLWECGGLSDNIVASPVFKDGIVYVGSSYTTRAIMAINIRGAAGDITASEHVLWNRVRGAPYVPSILLYDDMLYFHGHYQNVLWRVHGPSGEDQPGGMRLNGIRNVYASPVAAAGRIYITDLDGTTAVVSHADEPEVLALNHLDEPVSASAALAGREIFLRGERHLYCIRSEESEESPN